MTQTKHVYNVETKQFEDVALTALELAEQAARQVSGEVEEADRETASADRRAARDFASTLAQIQARQTEIVADLALLPTANATQQRQIVGRLLTAQDGILSLLLRMGKALSRLV